MTHSGRHQHESRLVIQEVADDARASADLQHDSLHHVVGLQLSPVARGKGVIGQSLGDLLLHEERHLVTAKVFQLLHDLPGSPQSATSAYKNQ